jgi:hypothetical protein
MAVVDDVRGHCARCAQWFEIPSDTVQAMMQALCPFCAGTVDQIEQRCGELRIAIDIATPRVSATVPSDPAPL